ncbi:hypothetical protein FIM50_08055 [Helicobacter pylori]|nr:hypothetical protein FIM50_08055 [Helicobacter pylori]
MLAISVFLPTLFVFPVFTDSITNLFFKKQSYPSKLYQWKPIRKNPLKLDQLIYINAQLSHGLSILFLTWLQRSKWGSRYQGLKKWK